MISKTVPIYVYCGSGGRSLSVAKTMKGLGFLKIVNLSGGIKESNCYSTINKSEAIASAKTLPF